MIRGTTPTFTLKVTGTTFDNSTVYVTIAQNISHISITKSAEDVTITKDEDEDVTTVQITLTQAETLSLKKGKASIQIRWIDADGIACATRIKEFEILDVLLNGEIIYVV